MISKNDFLERLSSCVVNMEDEEIEDVAKEYLKHGYSPQEGIMNGLVKGMSKAGELYEQEEYYIAELLLCSDAMYAGINILKKQLDMIEEDSRKIKIIIGVVEGDTHDIGKNLVKIMLETAGFYVIDLGRDVSLDRFIDSAIKEDASIICMSSLMTTTMWGMKYVIDRLSEMKIRDKIKVMIGGGPVTKEFADQIGADGYSENAIEAIKVAKKLVNLE